MTRENAVIDALRGSGRWTTIIAVLLSGDGAMASRSELERR